MVRCNDGCALAFLIHDCVIWLIWLVWLAAGATSTYHYAIKIDTHNASIIMWCKVKL